MLKQEKGAGCPSEWTKTEMEKGVPIGLWYHTCLGLIMMDTSDHANHSPFQDTHNRYDYPEKQKPGFIQMRKRKELWPVSPLVIIPTVWSGCHDSSGNIKRWWRVQMEQESGFPRHTHLQNVLKINNLGQNYLSPTCLAYLIFCQSAHTLQMGGQISTG